jgi:hypothetical protein
MPYIAPENRPKFDAGLNLLKEELRKGGYEAGELNYVISCLLNDAFAANTRYAEANKLVGVMEAAKLEFYRRKVAPYEDLKITENGDV